ncbi:hypothetical protein G7077_05480 [Sphingomonas piscis]|uniref:Uncharacterized protein n=1 Tax=Sphingomonas piscis TaxID=2714943 RepID=A0A6G7YNW1_9SPHN|nr:hypothetical protein [Sphingomonas piscis]QIK78435.1 hypothetical protein G7077_05480 [Sphingomonas piscis]
MSTEKVTSAGWPDPTDWANRLHQTLETIGTDYQAESWAVADDPEAFRGLNLKQARAAEALIAVNAALRELPQFRKSKGAAILHDVAGALRDVVMGGSPRLFQSVRPGGPGGDGVQRNYVKVWVVTAVRFLMQAHQLPTRKATELVANIFASAGAKGRKGNALSASTVNDWCMKAHPLSDNVDEVRIDREAQANLESYKSSPDWPGSYDETVTWIEAIANDPLLASKYG